MNEIRLTARFSIHPGNLEAFKAAAAVCRAAVAEREPGARRYDWFISADGTECVVQESYVDSDAVLAHVANVGEPLGELLKLSDLALDVFGELSDELAKGLEAIPHVRFAYHQGLDA